MKSKVFTSCRDAMADVPDGASILVGGFGTVGVPWNLLQALLEQGARDLTLICNSAGGGSLARVRRDIVSPATLIEQGRVRKVIASFTGSSHPSLTAAAETLAAAGALETELVPQGTLAERIRAGGAGIPAFYTPTGVGTIIADGKEQRLFGGRAYLLEGAITADYALLRAWKADTFGNLVFRLTQRNFSPLMATAARTTIVEVEEPLVAEGALGPDAIHTPGIYVHRLVQVLPPPAGVLHVSLLDAESGERA